MIAWILQMSADACILALCFLSLRLLVNGCTVDIWHAFIPSLVVQLPWHVLIPSLHFNRHLYMDPLSTCYMFEGCSPLFLDSVMMACKVELFMPKVSKFSRCLA